MFRDFCKKIGNWIVFFVICVIGLFVPRLHKVGDDKLKTNQTASKQRDHCTRTQQKKQNHVFSRHNIQNIYNAIQISRQRWLIWTSEFWKQMMFDLFDLGGNFGRHVCMFGVFCIINCYFNACIGFCVVFCIYEYILMTVFNICLNLFQECEQFS